MFGPAGVHLTKVLDVGCTLRAPDAYQMKKQTRPMRHEWVVTDTSFYNVDSHIEAKLYHHAVVSQKYPPPDVAKSADICGITCSEDRICPFAQLPSTLKVGDVICLFDLGAYGEVSANNFNALPRPAVVLVNASKAEIIRKAESFDDVFARDVIPLHLR
jgi:diaminopimelate decarboxylase